MLRKIVIPVILVVLALASRGDCRQAMLERYRYIGTASYSRIVVDLSQPAPFTVRSVRGSGPSTPPRRLIIDIPGASVGPEAHEPLVVRDALLRGIRTGEFAADVARVILDFANEAEVRVFTLQNPFRLIVDLRGSGSAQASRIVRYASTRPTIARAEPRISRSPTDAAANPSEPPRPPEVVASLPLHSQPRAAAPGESNRAFKIVIDPGHGGKDPGARGVGGIEEKDVVLSIALELAESLRTEPGVVPLLTRNDDRTLSLEERTAIANAAEADLFLSIHANASPHRSTRGTEVYYLNNTNNRGTLRLAAIENGLRWDPKNPSLQESIPDLSYILSDLRQVYKVEESRRLAAEVGEAVVHRLRGGYGGVGDFGVKEGPFYVLVGAYMPCVLVEVSYITNPIEGPRLASLDYRRTLAEGIHQGILSYIAQTKIAKNL